MSRTVCVDARPRWQLFACVGAAIACTYLFSRPVDAAELAAGGPAASRAETQFAEGLQLAAADEVPAAIAVFARMTEEYPQLPQPYAQLAALYARQGEPAKAIAPLRRALSLDNDKAALQEQLGDLYVELAAKAYADAGATRTSARNKAATLPRLQSNQPASESNR